MSVDEKHVHCQMCNAVLESEEFYTEKYKNDSFIHSLRFKPARWMGICSIDCAQKAIQYNAAWNLKEQLRNMQEIPFSMFVEKFGFDEAGGYAKDKYDKMRCNPWLFMLTLDKEKFKVLI